MYTVLLPLGVNPIAVKYIISYMQQTTSNTIYKRFYMQPQTQIAWKILTLSGFYFILL